MYLCVHMLSDSCAQQYVCTFMFCWRTHVYIYNFSNICYTLPPTADSYLYPIRANIYIQHIELLYIGAQHPYYTQLCSIDTRRYHRTSVLTAVGCVRRDRNQIFILVYAVYNNTCYTDIVDIQQPTYATIASSIYNNIHIYLYTQIQSYTRSHTA